ncbi:MAG: hypothetical protein K8R19_10025 [Methanosarcinales archaeon]|nr:hypothetical protein [Methanosarcinales archaeon]
MKTDKLPYESKIQSFIYSNFENFDEFIKNYDEILETDLTYQEMGTFEDFIKQFILQNFLKSFRKLYGFLPIGQEVPVIKTRGRPLSIDILGNNYETGEFFIIEIKRSNSTEREAITEILAYTNGIRSKFPELSTEDIVIIIIAHEWQASLWNATIFLMLFFRLNIIPIQIVDVDYDKTKDEVENISLEILIPSKSKDLTVSQNFSKKCLASKTFMWDDSRVQPREVANIVSKEMDRRNIHGFVIGLKFFGADDFKKGEGYPHPYGILITALNPYSIAKYRGLGENTNLNDIFHQNSSESLSLEELEIIWDNRLGEVTSLIYPLFNYTDYGEISIDMDYFNFSEIGVAGVSTLFEFIFINYTGLFHDFLLYRSILEWKIKEKQGHADILFGDIGSSVFQTYYSAEYFFELIEWIFPSDESCSY